MLKTEMRNEKSMHIDEMDSLAIARLMNEENRNAVMAVETECEKIAQAIDAVAEAFKKKGRLIYIGAGTSGRLGVLDASECPPTFGVPYDQVIGIIAGGYERLVTAGENAEDIGENGVADLKAISLCEKDVVVGISASGGAAYVTEALRYAKSLGCVTVSVTSNAGSPMDKVADISISPDTGAEVITGSTRLKAGTAQKLILNMISTGAMIRSGYVYENLMINLKPSNKKLRDRVIRITMEISGAEREKAIDALEKADWDIRKAVTSLAFPPKM